MFRRFMIVCWVLFAIAAIVGLVGWAGYQYYDSKATAYEEQQRENQESNSIPESKSLSASDRIMGEVDPKRNIVWEDPVIEKNKNSFAVAGLMGAILAAQIFLWNIIWHTGHWIWMGRKEQ